MKTPRLTLPAPIWLLLLLLHSVAALAIENRPMVREIDHVVAVVNDDVITNTELSRQTHMITQRIKQRGSRLPPTDVLQKQILEQMIIQRLQLQLAERMGIRVDDETINQVISNIARDNKLSLEQFRQVLERDGFAFAQFRQKIKQDIIISRLRKRRVQDKTHVTDTEVNNYLNNMANRKGSNDELHLAHILIAIPEAARPSEIQTAKEKAQTILNQLNVGADFAQTAIAASNGQRALEGGDLGWKKAGQLPTPFARAVTSMQQGDISGLIRSANGFHILKLLQRRSNDSRSIVKQTLARHILIRPNDVRSSGEARQRLEKVRQKLIEGGDFAQLARIHSDDTASAANGGSLGWNGKGKMVPEFEQVMDRLKPGEISKVFKTEFGWHIVQVMSRRQHDDTIESQRSKARQLIGKRKSGEAAESWLRQLRSEAYVELRLNQ